MWSSLRLRLSRPYWLTSLAFVAYIPAYASLFIFDFFDGKVLVALINAGGAIAPLAAGLMALVVSRQLSGRARRGWSLVAFGAALWGAGDLIWFFYEVLLGRDPFPSPADALYLAGYPSLFVGIVLVTGPLGWRPHLRVGLDAAAVAVGAMAIAWNQLIGPVLAQDDVPLLERVIAALYPVWDIALIFAAIVALPRRRGLGNSSVLLLFSVGLVAILMADVSFAYLTLHDDYATGSLADLGWLAGYCLLGLAASMQARLPADQGFEELESIPSWRQVLPLLGLPLMVWWLVSEAREAVTDDAVLVLGMVAVFLVVARQVLSFFDALANAGRLELAYQNLNIAHSRLRERATGLEADLVAEHARASIDVTTGALSRLGIEERLHEVATTMRDRGGNLAVILVDVDLLKAYNDRYGHAAGDEALRGVAQALQHNPCAIVGRFGGDEFLVLLPDTHREGAELYIAASEAALVHSESGQVPHVEFSAGYAIYPDEAADLKQAFRLADSRMYDVKSGKRADRRAAAA